MCNTKLFFYGGLTEGKRRLVDIKRREEEEEEEVSHDISAIRFQ